MPTKSGYNSGYNANSENNNNRNANENANRSVTNNESNNNNGKNVKPFNPRHHDPKGLRTIGVITKIDINVAIIAIFTR